MAKMRKFILRTIKAERDGGFTSLIFDGEHTPQKVVEADSVQSLVPLFEEFRKEIEATGKPYDVCVMYPRQPAPKPPGFEKATDRGGVLHAYVNLDKPRAA